MTTKTLISESLGTFKAPSSAFAPTTGAEAATTFERILSIAIGGFTLVAAIYFLFTLLVAAFSWMSAAGDQSKVQKARDTMTNGLIGLVVIIAAYAIIGVVSTMLGIDILNPGKLLLELAP
jgi:uncharacterized membrane protein YphA (DoxX/SURF4 family)